MSWNHAVSLAMWLSGPPICAFMLFKVRQRRLWHLCPVFFWYLGCHIARFAVLFSVRTNAKAYFVSYWSLEVVDVFLVTAVLYNLYSQLFRGYQGLRVWQGALFRWAAAVCILIAVAITASVQGRETSWLLSIVFAFDVGTAVLKTGLIAFVLVISTALAMRWSRYGFAIVIGLGLESCVELAVATVRLQMGDLASQPYRLIKPAAYVCALLVWLVCFYGKERKEVPLTLVPHNDLASWNEALVQLLTK